MSTFDVWVIRFAPGGSPPAERLQSAFGIDLASAQAIEQNLPRVVKHAVPAKQAGEMRQVLESIGAVVECRPARGGKSGSGPGMGDGQAVFQRPEADLLPGRVSAIDPFAPAIDAGVPRISVDDPVPPLAQPAPPPMPRSTSHPPENTSPRIVSASLLATSREQQRRKFTTQAIGTIAAGIAIISIGLFVGSSVFRGEADWVGIGFDTLGIYFLGVGAYDLYTTWRS